MPHSVKKSGRTVKPILSGRTRFTHDIVAEFWAPAKPSRKALIICDGCPTMPSKRKVGEYFARKGYWVFHPRYRGSWESGGKFLEYPPNEDVRLVAQELNGGFTNIYDGKRYLLDISEIVVLGASFGGAAALLSSQYPEVTKVIALSPVIDWKAKSKAEPFDYFVRLLEEGFGEGYRPATDAWKKLRSGKFYSPKHDDRKLSFEKIFIAHAKDDEVVPVAPLLSLAKKMKIKPLVIGHGGHFSISTVMHPLIRKKIKEFL